VPNFNLVILMGNLTRDPELRHLPASNMPVCGFGLAINRKWKDKAGAEQEEVCFVDCEAFGKTAEVVNQYCNRGSALHVQGRLKLDQWKDKEGQPRQKLKVIVDQITFVGGRDGEQGGQSSGASGGTSGGASRSTTQRQAPSNRPAARPQEEPALSDADVPF
jgi:single-strand DNA-binding protein